MAVSTDQGTTFRPLLTFDQVRRVKPCVRDFCHDVCSYLAGLTLWPQQVCGDAPDAGADADAGTGRSPSKGCACDAGGQAAGDRARVVLLAGVCLVAWCRRHRRRTKT